MMEWRPISLLVIFFLSVGFDFHGFLFSHANPIRLELIHRDNPLLIGQLPRPKQTQLERLKELVQNDITRHRVISYKRGQWGASRRRNDLELKASIEMPMHSGADFGTGQYFVEVKVGKPAQQFLLIADTASELTWVNCRYGTHKDKGRLLDPHRPRVFHADRSSSFRPVPCASEMCKVGLAVLDHMKISMKLEFQMKIKSWMKIKLQIKIRMKFEFQMKIKPWMMDEDKATDQDNQIILS
jgi:hypothetical protein